MGNLQVVHTESYVFHLQRLLLKITGKENVYRVYQISLTSQDVLIYFMIKANVLLMNVWKNAIFQIFVHQVKYFRFHLCFALIRFCHASFTLGPVQPHPSLTLTKKMKLVVYSLFIQNTTNSISLAT